MKPPFTTITKYDLNKPTIVWQVGLGDDPTLAAEGITGTGMTQMRNSILVTDTGLVFGPGGDNKIRAYDAETGKILWTGSFGGTFRGAPALYTLAGRQYLLVPAAGNRLPAGNQAAPAGNPPGPLGYVAFALPQ
jgi:quinoprotein glucose dehydrogenase